MWQQIAQLLTEWNGVPIWGMLIVMIVTLIKTYPIIQRNLLEARDKREGRYSLRITELEDAVEACQKECEQHKEELRKEIRDMHETLLGQRRQHIQEQISLIAAIVESVDNPILKQLLSRLQSVQRVEELSGVVGDAQKLP